MVGGGEGGLAVSPRRVDYVLPRGKLLRSRQLPGGVQSPRARDAPLKLALLLAIRLGNRGGAVASFQGPGDPIPDIPLLLPILDLMLANVTTDL